MFFPEIILLFYSVFKSALPQFSRYCRKQHKKLIKNVLRNFAAHFQNGGAAGTKWPRRRAKQICIVRYKRRIFIRFVLGQCVRVFIVERKF